MAKRGRRTSAGSIVGRLEGPPLAKERVLAVLGNLGGTLPASEAAGKLRLSSAMFRRLRELLLVASLGALEPRRRGRPARVVPGHARELRRLEARVSDLEEELALSRVREEIALVLPWAGRSQKKARRTRPRQSAGMPSAPPAS